MIEVATGPRAGLSVPVGHDYTDGPPSPSGTVSYLDRAAVGALFGVSAVAVAKWQGRDPTFPAPDIVLGERELPGWSPRRAEEIRAWYAARPGQGAPGRPKPGSGRWGKRQPE